MDHHAVNDEALDTIFRRARTQNKWLDRPVSTAMLMAIYDLMRMGPTSANCSPANAPKVRSAPATAIIGYDLDFASHLPKLFPHSPGAKDWFADPAVEQVTAFRNGSLQGAYIIIAARSLGLDCGPMSGFNNEAVDKAFFAGTRVKSNFICSVGHGDPSGLFERSPRLTFDEACKIA
jgi:3-hydroxypropanoate dehydrogenase